jgi:hypothetical protein
MCVGKWRVDPQVVGGQREVIMMYDGWRRVGGLGREVSKLVARIGK